MVCGRQRYVSYIWLDKISTNEGQHYLGKVLSHKPKYCPAVDKWIAIWGWQTPQLSRPEQAPNQNHENRGGDDSFDGLMSGRYAWHQVIVVVNILALLLTMVILYHYNDVIVGTVASQITSLTVVYSTVIQTQIKEDIKAPRHWPLWGEFTGDRWIPRTNGQYRGKCFQLMTSSCQLLNYFEKEKFTKIFLCWWQNQNVR